MPQSPCSTRADTPSRPSVYLSGCSNNAASWSGFCFVFSYFLLLLSLSKSQHHLRLIQRIFLNFPGHIRLSFIYYFVGFLSAKILPGHSMPPNNQKLLYNSLVAQLVKDPLAMQEATCSTGDPGSISGSGRFPRRRKWQPPPLFLPGNTMTRGAWSRIATAGHNLATKPQPQFCIKHLDGLKVVLFLNHSDMIKSQTLLVNWIDTAVKWKRVLT